MPPLTTLRKQEVFRARIDSMYRLYSSPLRLLALRTVKSRDLANDVVQEVFRRVLEHPEHLPAPDKERAYLRRATYQEALHQLARAESHLNAGKRLVFEALRHAPAPSDEFLAKTLTATLARAIADLPLRYRQAFRLRCISGLSRREASQQMGISMKAVDEEVRRAKTILREELQALRVE